MRRAPARGTLPRRAFPATALDSPASAIAGNLVTLVFSITNGGPVPAAAPWSYSLLLSLDTNGLFFAGRKDIDNPAANRKLANILDHRRGFVTQINQIVC